VFAAKVIAKDTLTKARAKQKLMSEIKIHRSLHHEYIVGFDRFFEDDVNVYILLELCPNQSMNELIRRRKRLTEIEVQCYCKQILEALRHLHAHRIIHRDLKLGNLFLSDKLEIKLGDFGLAAKLEFDGERKRTICGTPNYIAPEILEGSSQGHSYEVDVWSFGVVLYTLLVGKPPFETNDVKTTYRRIKMNAYSFPDNIQVSEDAKSIITRILRSEPQTRPTLEEIACHDFFQKNSIPKTLPVSTLAVPPSEHFLKQFMLKEQPRPALVPSSDTAPHRLPSPRDTALRPATTRLNAVAPTPEPRPRSQTKTTKPSSSKQTEGGGDVWVTKWIDYSRKYGLGYLLSDGSYGVYFNDASKIAMSANGCTFYYIERSHKSAALVPYSLEEYPSDLAKKVTLLLHFRKYLGAPSPTSKSSGQPVFMKKWLSTKQSILFRLSNKIVQVDFVDHTELILSSAQKLVTYIDKQGSKHQFSLATAMQSDFSEMTKRLRYTKDILSKLMSSENQGNAGPVTSR
jgi:polo-like kinase 1